MTSHAHLHKQDPIFRSAHTSHGVIPSVIHLVTSARSGTGILLIFCFHLCLFPQPESVTLVTKLLTECVKSNKLSVN